MIPWGLIALQVTQAKTPAPQLKTQTETVVAPLRTVPQTLQITRGSGPLIKAGDLVSIHYKMVKEGRVFADTERHGLTYEFVVGDAKVPSFFSQSVIGLQQNGGRQSLVPWEASGTQNGFPPILPPKTDFELTIRVMSVRPVSS
ncbi:MAG: FKBP-type peptidyl-prolyl cis-trans isomerase [Armatimonadetes bacterium]|nr:FKBP-type peptidyl-prolyl cis-trans isomerase [Armatimonadota bacterium]